MNRTILFTALLILLTASPTNAQVLQANRSSTQTHGQWSSFVLSDSSGKVSRMITKGEGDQSILSVTFVPPSCQQEVSTIFPYDRPLEVDTAEIPINLTIRVDSSKPYLAPGYYTGTMGDNFGFVVLDAFSDFNEMMLLFAAGSKVRIKYQWDQGGATVAYSLFGFSAAFRRAHDLCESLATPNNKRPSRNQMPPIDTMPRNVRPL